MRKSEPIRRDPDQRTVRVLVDAGEFNGAPVELLRRAVETVFVASGLDGGEISVTLLPDGEMARLNRKYFAKDGPTDVIAFSLGEEFWPLGDVYLGGEQAGRQAAAHGIELEEEFVRLAIHGCLHVLGHDHPEGENRSSSPMFRLQERLVSAVMTRRDLASKEDA